MTSAKQSKRRRQAARVAPPPPVTSRKARRTASPRVLLAAGAVVVLIAVAAVLAVVLTSGSSKPKASIPAVGSLVDALPGAAAVHKLFAGVPQHGLMLGRANAPVTLVAYIDMQCPGCQQFETEFFPAIVRDYVRTGRLRVDARPIAFIGPDSSRGRDAALAAGLQNRFFNFSELLYANQGTENTGWLDDAFVRADAASIPDLRVQQLLHDISSPRVRAEEKTIDAQSDADNVSETPTLFVGKTGAKGALVTSYALIPKLIAAAAK